MKTRLLYLLLLLLLVGLALGGGHLWARGHYREAQLALTRRDFVEAQRHLALCSKVWFRGADTHLLLARTARMAGEYDLASTYLRECRELGVPSETLTLEYQLMRVGQGDLAIVEYELVSRVMQGHPDAVLILETLTPAYLANYQLQQALQCILRWIELEPDRLQAWIYRADASERFKNSDESLISHRRIVELDPDNLGARIALAGLLTDRSPEEAKAHFEYVRQRQGDQAAVLTGLARCERVLGRTEEARQLYEAVLAAEPNNWATLSARARLAQETESTEEAEKWFRRAAAVRPFEKEALHGLYTCLLRLGKHREAQEVLARLDQIKADLDRLSEVTREVVLKPRDPNLRCEAGTILLRNGQELAGLDWLATALREDPKHAGAHRALAEYNERTGDAEKAAHHRKMAALGR